MDSRLRPQAQSSGSPGQKSAAASSKRQYGETGSKEEKQLDYHEVYADLHGAIADLNQNIDHRIAANDADFMEAYRGHMLRIQKELDRLRKKTNEREFIIKKDERVRKLEAQIAWFRDEALYLSNKIQQQTKQIDRLKERCFCLEEERSYHLDIHEKEIKKNGILRKALEHSEKNCGELVVLVKKSGQKPAIQGEASKSNFYLTALNEEADRDNTGASGTLDGLKHLQNSSINIVNGEIIEKTSQQLDTDLPQNAAHAISANRKSLQAQSSQRRKAKHLASSATSQLISEILHNCVAQSKKMILDIEWASEQVAEIIDQKLQMLQHRIVKHRQTIENLKKEMRRVQAVSHSRLASHPDQATGADKSSSPNERYFQQCIEAAIREQQARRLDLDAKQLLQVDVTDEEPHHFTAKYKSRSQSAVPRAHLSGEIDMGNAMDHRPTKLDQQFNQLSQSERAGVLEMFLSSEQTIEKLHQFVFSAELGPYTMADQRRQYSKGIINTLTSANPSSAGDLVDGLHHQRDEPGTFVTMDANQGKDKTRNGPLDEDQRPSPLQQNLFDQFTLLSKANNIQNDPKNFNADPLNFGRNSQSQPAPWLQSSYGQQVSARHAQDQRWGRDALRQEDLEGETEVVKASGQSAHGTMDRFRLSPDHRRDNPDETLSQAKGLSELHTTEDDYLDKVKLAQAGVTLSVGEQKESAMNQPELQPNFFNRLETGGYLKNELGGPSIPQSLNNDLFDNKKMKRAGASSSNYIRSIESQILSQNSHPTQIQGSRQPGVSFGDRTLHPPQKQQFAASHMPKHTRNPFKASFTRTSVVSNAGNPETGQQKGRRKAAKGNEGSRTLRFLNAQNTAWSKPQGSSTAHKITSDPTTASAAQAQSKMMSVSSPLSVNLKSKYGVRPARGQSSRAGAWAPGQPLDNSQLLNDYAVVNLDYGPGQQNPQIVTNISTTQNNVFPNTAGGYAMGIEVSQKRLSYPQKGSRPKTSKQIQRINMNTIDTNQEMASGDMSPMFPPGQSRQVGSLYRRGINNGKRQMTSTGCGTGTAAATINVPTTQGTQDFRPGINRLRAAPTGKAQAKEFGASKINASNIVVQVQQNEYPGGSAQTPASPSMKGQQQITQQPSLLQDSPTKIPTPLHGAKMASSIEF